eukprot:2789982-Rhodomonas_salina.1
MEGKRAQERTEGYDERAAFASVAVHEHRAPYAPPRSLSAGHGAKPTQRVQVRTRDCRVNLRGLPDIAAQAIASADVPGGGVWGAAPSAVISGGAVCDCSVHNFLPQYACSVHNFLP